MTTLSIATATTTITHPKQFHLLVFDPKVLLLENTWCRRRHCQWSARRLQLDNNNNLLEWIGSKRDRRLRVASDSRTRPFLNFLYIRLGWLERPTFAIAFYVKTRITLYNSQFDSFLIDFKLVSRVFQYESPECDFFFFSSVFCCSLV